MPTLYLASSIDRTGMSIGKEISNDPSTLRLAFIATAAEPEKADLGWLKNDRAGLERAGFEMFDYSITGKSVEDFDRDLGNVDVIHVNGGNTFYLLLQARKSGFDRWIADWVKREGKTYTGSSAGSIIASPDIGIVRKIETQCFEEELNSTKGFGLTDIIILPHWGSDDFRELYLNHRMDVAYKPENKIILLNDWQYVKATGKTFEIVDVREDKGI